MTELDADARNILELARQARTPTSADKARVGRLLGSALLLSGSTAHATSSGAATKVVGTALAAKWAGVVLLAFVGAAGVVGWRAWHAPHRSAVQEAPAAVATDPATPENPAQGNGVVARRSAHETETSVPAAELAAPRAVSPGARATGVHATLSEELDLLHDAQAKWRAGNATSALALLAEHRQRFPRSQVAPERDALTVLCLCATHRTAEARKLARRFLQGAPHSPLRASIEDSCAGGG